MHSSRFLYFVYCITLETMFKLQNLANIITLTRILGVGFIFWLTPYTTNFIQIIVILIFTLVSATDFLDGWIARKFKIESELGKVLDPLADKILVLVFLPLLEMQVITSFPVFIILAREFAIMALRIVSISKGHDVMPASFSGKLKTAFTLPVCGILLGRVAVSEVSLPLWMTPIEWLRVWVMAWPTWVMTSLVYAVVFVTIWSFLDYFGSFIWQQYVKKYNGDESLAKKAALSLIPNAFSLANLGCGCIASVLAWYGFYQPAVLLVLIGIFLDGIDGSLARKLNAESKLGARLDSNADFMSFGVAPSIVIYTVLSQSLMTWLSLIIAFLYYASVHYRLRRFDNSGHSDYFDGLPSPVGAALVVVAAISEVLSYDTWFIPIILIVAGLMASSIPYPHLNVANRKRFFRALKIPSMIFLVLTILKLLNLPYAQTWYVYEALFVTTSVYLFFPLGRLFSAQDKD